jgi:pyruvate-ferredoxin/flavodoxin oxidoreductase
MPGLRTHAIRWYRKVFAAPTGSDIRDEGLDTVLDGNSAVALSEAGLASHLAQNAEGPRGIVASATGLALAGRRATAFVSGPDIAATQDLLISAAGKHAPLVLHLGARATAAHGSAPGTSHDTVHLSADAGFFMMFAANVQEAVDFTHIARRVAEEALVPGMVVMDGEQTALAPQDVRLLSPAQIDSLVGSAREQIEAPTAAQKLLFGDTRRRVPAWHDLDEPVLSGTLFDQQSFALGAIARRPYFDAFVGESMAAAFTAFEAKTGRRYGCVSRHKLDDAQTVLLAQGASIETARLAADHLRRQHKLRVGVLGIHTLRPFPEDEITAALKGCGNVFVLERVEAPLSAEPPLTREVRASLKSSDASHSPQCHPVVYGLGGLPLRVADLIELCTGADSHPTEPLFLGISFDDTSGEQPKREVLLDALRRAYPGTASMGVRADSDATGSRQPDSLTVAIQRIGAGHGKDILGTAGALLRSLEGGRIRSRPAVTWQHWSEPLVDIAGSR